MRILTIQAHCVDCFVARLQTETKDAEYFGYVPQGLNIGCGDDVVMKIDLDTGQILNWKPVSDKNLIRLFGG